MWYQSENSDAIKPAEIDETSSQSYIYARKDFEEVPIYDQLGQQIGTHWRYMENKINKSDWDMYSSLLNNEEKIAKQGADIAPTENNETALERYVVGSYIFRNDELYKVISEIPYGATFTSNNIQKTTIMDELLSKLQEV